MARILIATSGDAGHARPQVGHLPFAVATASLSLLHTGDDALAALVGALSSERAAAFEAFGFTPELRGLSIVSPVMNLIFATPSLVSGALPANTHLVGPSL